jgi:hypothetical protein
MDFRLHHLNQIGFHEVEITPIMASDRWSFRTSSAPIDSKMIASITLNQDDLTDSCDRISLNFPPI